MTTRTLEFFVRFQSESKEIGSGQPIVFIQLNFGHSKWPILILMNPNGMNRCCQCQSQRRMCSIKLDHTLPPAHTRIPGCRRCNIN